MDFLQQQWTTLVFYLALYFLCLSIAFNFLWNTAKKDTTFYVLNIFESLLEGRDSFNKY